MKQASEPTPSKVELAEIVGSGCLLEYGSPKRNNTPTIKWADYGYDFQEWDMNIHLVVS